MDSEFWLWEYVDEDGKRKRTRYRLKERDALDRYGPCAKRVERSLERRAPPEHERLAKAALTVGDPHKPETGMLLVILITPASL